MKKLLMVASVLLPLYCCLHATPAVCAESKEILAEGTYVMGDGETPIVAEGRAIEQAKRDAVEQAGTYVKSYTRVKDFQIAEDEIEVLASGMMEVTVLDKKRTVEAEAIKFWVKVRATVTPDKIDVMVEQIRGSGLSQEYKQIKDAYEMSQAEVARLKAQLAAAKGEPERKEIISKISAQEKAFQSRQLQAEAVGHFAAGRKAEALEVLSRSVAENPGFYPAYVLRGWVHYSQTEYDKAIADFNKVIELTPKGPYGASAYAGRGSSFSQTARCKEAVADLKEALRLDPYPPKHEVEVGIHAHLGKCLLMDGDRQQAREHYRIACSLNELYSCKALESPRFKNLKEEPGRTDIAGGPSVREKESQARKLYGNALRHSSAGRTDEAIDLFSRSIEQNPGYYPAYLHRGWAYYRQRKYDNALSDFNKVIELAPNVAGGYTGRGMVLSWKKRFEAAIADLNQSLRLDPNPPKELAVGLHTRLGFSLLAKGEHQQAKDHLELSCRLGQQQSCKALESPKLKDLK